MVFQVDSGGMRDFGAVNTIQVEITRLLGKNSQVHGGNPRSLPGEFCDCLSLCNHVKLYPSCSSTEGHTYINILGLLVTGYKVTP
jgi:hypothetical protein